MCMGEERGLLREIVDSAQTPSLYESSCSSLPSPFLTLSLPTTSISADLDTPSSGSPSMGPLSSVMSSFNHDRLLGKLHDLPDGRFRSQSIPTSKMSGSLSLNRGYESHGSRPSFSTVSTVRTTGSTTSYHSPSSLLKPYFTDVRDEPTDGTSIASPDDRRTTLHFQRAWEGLSPI